VRWKKSWSVALLALPLAFAARAAPPGSVAIVLPPRLVAGRLATLAVLDADGRLAPGCAVEFAGGGPVVTDSTGRAPFTAPAVPGILLARLVQGDAKASAVVLAPESVPSGGVRLVDFPRLISRDDRFFVSGAGFESEADRNHVLLGGKPALVLAASPDSLVLLPNPQTALGPTRLEIAGATVPVTLVTVELDSAKPQLARGQRAALAVRVVGTDLPVQLEASNLTPEIVKLRGGNRWRLKTLGGDDNPATIELEGLRPGDYALEVRLAGPPAGLPDIEAAQHALLEARRVAPPSQVHQLDQLIRELTRRPKWYVHVRDQLEKMLPQASGEFARALLAAWEILGGR